MRISRVGWLILLALTWSGMVACRATTDEPQPQAGVIAALYDQRVGVQRRALESIATAPPEQARNYVSHTARIVDLIVSRDASQSQRRSAAIRAYDAIGFPHRDNCATVFSLTGGTHQAAVRSAAIAATAAHCPEEAVRAILAGLTVGSTKAEVGSVKAAIAGTKFLDADQTKALGSAIRALLFDPQASDLQRVVALETFDEGPDKIRTALTTSDLDTLAALETSHDTTPQLKTATFRALARQGRYDHAAILARLANSNERVAHEDLIEALDLPVVDGSPTTDRLRPLVGILDTNGLRAWLRLVERRDWAAALSSELVALVGLEPARDPYGEVRAEALRMLERIDHTPASYLPSLVKLIEREDEMWSEALRVVATRLLWRNGTDQYAPISLASDLLANIQPGRPQIKAIHLLEAGPPELVRSLARHHLQPLLLPASGSYPLRIKAQVVDLIARLGLTSDYENSLRDALSDRSGMASCALRRASLHALMRYRPQTYLPEFVAHLEAPTGTCRSSAQGSRTDATVQLLDDLSRLQPAEVLTLFDLSLRLTPEVDLLPSASPQLAPAILDGIQDDIRFWTFHHGGSARTALIAIGALGSSRRDPYAPIPVQEAKALVKTLQRIAMSRFYQMAGPNQLSPSLRASIARGLDNVIRRASWRPKDRSWLRQKAREFERLEKAAPIIANSAITCETALSLLQEEHWFRSKFFDSIDPWKIVIWVLATLAAFVVIASVMTGLLGAVAWFYPRSKRVRSLVDHPVFERATKPYLMGGYALALGFVRKALFQRHQERLVDEMGQLGSAPPELQFCHQGNWVPLADARDRDLGPLFLIHSQEHVGTTALNVLAQAALGEKDRTIVYLRAENCPDGVLEYIAARLRGPIKSHDYLRTLVTNGDLEIYISNFAQAPESTQTRIHQFVRENADARLFVSCTTSSQATKVAMKAALTGPPSPHHQPDAQQQPEQQQ